MARIVCDVTACRFNSRQLCTLPGIQVGPAPVTVRPDVLGATASFYDGQLRAGYATEFEAYVEYAHHAHGNQEDGAACLSYSPL